MAQKISPWLKNRSEIANDDSTSRSSVRSETGRRQSIRPAMNSRLIGSRSHHRLTSRPYVSGSPRACIQPTCGPVRTSVTSIRLSSTLTSATSLSSGS